jgi:hypothetical protein
MRVRMSLPYLICGFSMERVRTSFCSVLSYSRATRFVVPRSSATDHELFPEIDQPVFIIDTPDNARQGPVAGDKSGGFFQD